MDLFVFTGDSALAEACAPLVTGFIVDWERTDKSRRQIGWDTQISSEPRNALLRVRSAVSSVLVVRVNNAPGIVDDDIRAAIDGGADEVLVPMVRTPDELEVLLDRYGSQISIGTMIETPTAVARIDEFARLPLARAFVGLNDLAIARGDTNLFDPLVDGTVLRVRQRFDGALGFGGVTDPDKGSPVPARILLRGMVGLGCDFTFLRRSFHRDIDGQDITSVLTRIQAAVSDLEQGDVENRGAGIAELRDFLRPSHA